MGDSGIGFEALSTGDCRLFRSSARNWPRRLLGFLQQYRSKADLTARDADFRFTLKADSERTSYHVRFVPEADVATVASGLPRFGRTPPAFAAC
jgi:hypothetical protein